MTKDCLVDVDWLAAHLDDPQVRVLDCTVKRWVEADGSFHSAPGTELYARGHIPGAAHVDVVQALSDPDSPLRFTLPTPERFAEAVSALGVSDTSRVVLYSGTEVQWATRVWWMFRVFGFGNVAVLDGGLQAWRAAGRPLSTEPVTPPRGRFTPGFRPELVADKDDVLAAVGNGGACLLNALAPDVYAGSNHIRFGPRDGHSRPGHIQGSVNLWVMDLVDADTNRFLPPDVLREKFSALDLLDKEAVVIY